VTYECDYPAEAGMKPVVSDTALPRDRPLTAAEIDHLVADFMARREPIYRLDKELIQRIQPDLILAQDLCRVCAVPSGQVQDALAELGCASEVLSLDPHTIGEILDCILAVGRSTGTEPTAESLVAGLRSRIDRVRTRSMSLTPLPTLCLEWSDPPFVAGHWIPGMIEMAAGRPLLNPPGQASRRVPWSAVEAAAPEVIVFMPCGYGLRGAASEAEGLFDVAEFAEAPAARMGNVFAVDASSYFSRPGPRVVDGLEILAWAIHPEAFPEPPPASATRIAG
jgi:iron complex transport system substrate-binding protein